MELEGRPGQPLMLKECLELESRAELSRDGFRCYPRHLAAELWSGTGGRRNGHVIAKVSAAVRAALFPPLGREGEAALCRSFSRRLRVGFWKKRSGEGVDRPVASCSATTASRRRDGSSPAVSPRRRSWEGGQAGGVGAGVGGRQSHETEIDKRQAVGCETTCHSNAEQEQKQRRSPISVMDFLSQDGDDGDDADGHGDTEDDADDDIASPAFEQSLANIRRASQQLLQEIRQFEQLAELDTSDVDDATTATEDISCHMAESDSIGEDGEAVPVQGLLDVLQASTPGSTHCFQKLLVDFFCEGLSPCHGERSDGPDRAKSLLEIAKAWLDGQSCSVTSDWKADMDEIEWIGRWRCFSEDEQETLAVDLEGDIFRSLVGELVGELR